MMPNKDQLDWIDDYTVHLTKDEVNGMINDVGETLFYEGPRTAAALWLTLTGVFGGVFGALLASAQMWDSFFYLAGYVAVMPLSWMALRKLTMKIFGPAIRWQAVLGFFWMFLLCFFVVRGGQIDGAFWAYAVGGFLGAIVGLVAGSIDPPGIRHKVAWTFMSLGLGLALSIGGTMAHRNYLSGDGEMLTCAALGAFWALLYSLPMMSLLMWSWNRAAGLRYMASVYLHNEEFAPKAVDCLNRAIALAPNDPELYNLRGIAHAQAKDFARADEDWKKMLELEPSSVEPLMNRGVDFFAQKKYDQAVEILEKVVQMDPKNFRAHSNLGAALEGRGDFTRAISHYDHALALKPNYVRAYANRSYAHFRAGHFEQAVKDGDTAISLDPENAHGYLNRAHALAAQGKRQEAIEDYQTALSFEPSAEIVQEAEKGLADLGVNPALRGNA